MPLRPDVLGDRRFWAALYSGAFGQTREPPESAAFCSCLAVDEQGTLEWYQQFTGGYPGIFDDSDGYSDDPATAPLRLANGVQLLVEFHPGDQYWYLRSKDGVKVLLANIGPHWALPGLRWQEAVAIGDAAPHDGWMAVLLLLPTVWLTAGDNVRSARRAAESAWAASNLVDPSSALALAELWASAVAGGRDFRWQRVSRDWLCDAEWSTRSDRRSKSESRLVNRLVRGASSSP
jgi:hypothetical protein